MLVSGAPGPRLAMRSKWSGAAIEPLKREAVALAALHDLARERVGLRPGETAVQPDLADDLRDLGGCEVARERDEARPRGEQAERGWDIREVVRGQEPDPLAGFDARG